MIKIVISGACGRMGFTILNLALKDKDFEIAGLIEAPNHQQIGNKISGIEVTYDLANVIEKTDIVIEFTNPEATISHLEIVKNANKRIVIGTTGFDEKQKEFIKNVSKEIPIVLSPNMSIGVNLLFELIKNTVKVIPDYDTEIIELHHNQKKDAPSGTALKIAEIISKEKNLKLDETAIYGRKGITGPRKKQELGIHAIRAGDIVGEHTVIFAGPGERIELTHRAHSRETFAAGALKAAKWIINKPPGLYDMFSVLGLK